MKKITSLLLTVLLIISMLSMIVIPASAANVYDSGFNSAISTLKTKYIHGQYWNSYNSVGYEGTGSNICPSCNNAGRNSCAGDCPDNCGQFYYGGVWISGQCLGWACKIGNYIFGGNPYAWGSHQNGANIKPGDIIYGNLTAVIGGATTHAIFITGVSGNSVSYADCNSTGLCRINWYGSTTISAIQTSCSRGARIYHASNNYVGTASNDIIYTSITPGIYYIKNKSTGTYLSVEGEKDVNGQNVIVAGFKNSNAYKMNISVASTGYVICPLLTYRVINPFSDNVVSGINVNIYDYVNNSTQWWRFESAGSGYYYIRNVQNPSCCLTVSGTNVKVSTYSGSNAQKWSLISPGYKIVYNANSGSGSMTSQTVQFGDTVTFRKNTFERAGYKFIGWNIKRSSDSKWHVEGKGWFTESEISSNGYKKQVYVDQGKPTIDGSWTSQPSETFTLYAVWQANTLKVNYHANGGKIFSNTYKLSSSVVYKISDNSKYVQSWTYNKTKTNGLVDYDSTFGIYRDGYTFLGWSTSKTGGTVMKQNDTSIVPTDITSSIKNGSCTVTLYARWAPATSKTLVNSTALFTDVPSNAWYKGKVDYVITYDLMNGTGNNLFQPNKSLTRAEFVQMLANIAGINTGKKDKTTAFSDVPKDKWYAPAVKWATDEGIVSGTGNGKFSPDVTITREQMCLMLKNYVEKHLDSTLPVFEAKQTFADDAQISSWAKSAVYACQRADIINGMTSTQFAPRKTATRAEAATLISRFFDLYFMN